MGQTPGTGDCSCSGLATGRSKARGMRRGNRPSERPESTNGPEHVHMATDRTATPFRPPETPPDRYSPRDRPAGKGNGPVSGPRTRLPSQPIDSIILIALACFLGIGSRRYAPSLPEFIAVYVGETLWASAARMSRPMAS